MNDKRIKQIRKAIRKHKRQIILRVLTDIKSWPFRSRLKFAWQIIKGK